MVNRPRLWIAFATLLLTLMRPAFAGDVANLAILGFGEDGGIFAFEEYGELDGSGGGYSNRSYIDTGTDRFIGGSPIRIRLEDDIDVVAKARARSKVKGEAIVASSELEANPGNLAGFNAVTELSADPFRMSVNPRPVFHAVDPPLEFRLEEFPIVAPAGCENMGDIVGFRLLRIDSAPGGMTTIVHEDQTVPKSRNCPNGYKIGAIQTFYGGSDGPVFAVMVSIRSMGFEGPDFRWMAVTGRF